MGVKIYAIICGGVIHAIYRYQGTSDNDNEFNQWQEKTSAHKNANFWGVTPCGFVRIHVSEERAASILRVEIISELGATLAVTSN
jgi:hypothetical protein